MKIKVRLLLLLLILPYNILGQGSTGSWEDYLPYNTFTGIVKSHEDIYASTPYNIVEYHPATGEINRISTINGLSECGISCIAYHSEKKKLIVSYSSTNIDIYEKGHSVSVSDIFDAYIPGEKTINSITVNNEYAYLATSFGIVILNIDKAEIFDTWKPSTDADSKEVYDICFTANKIYASTSDGILYADSDNTGLAYYGNWAKAPGFNDGANYPGIEALGDNILCFRRDEGSSEDSLYIYKNQELSFIRVKENNHISSINSSDNKFLVSWDSEITVHSPSGDLISQTSTYSPGEVRPSEAIMFNGKIMAADRESGIVIEKENGVFHRINIPGPLSADVGNLYFEDGNFYMAGGQIDNIWHSTFNTFNALVFYNRQWLSISMDNTGDVIRVRPNPLSPGEYYASSWGSGLFKLNGEEIEQHYNETNSPLNSAIPGSDEINIFGLAFDNENNLWITHSGVSNNIKVLRPDNSWIVLPYTLPSPTVGDIIIDRHGYKWIVLPGGYGIYVIDDNNTPSVSEDDRSVHLSVKDQGDTQLNNLFCIREDRDGNIWIGTDSGPAVFYNPDRVFESEIRCTRIKIPRNDGTGLADYLLGTEQVNDIAIDGANRKWFATENSGVHLLSDNDSELIKTYNTDNSPLFSNRVFSVAVNNQTGELWSATDKGIIGVRETATEGKTDYGQAYAFPNPVRPDYQGVLTLSGLLEGTQVRISDLSGRLVYRTSSLGGQATWDLKLNDGTKASSGIYLAFCSSPDGSKSTIIKILVIR